MEGSRGRIVTWLVSLFFGSMCRQGASTTSLALGGLSAHADQAGLLEWYGHIGAHAPVYLVHGEDIARQALADKLRERFRCRVELSQPSMTVAV